MKRAAWLVLISLAVACSGRDQSLGETRPSPRPIIDPTPKPDTDTDPDPDPDPDPAPSVPPCEDSSKHERTGFCVPRFECRVAPITSAGYECEGDAVCCHEAVGCGTGGCTPGGGAPSEGGAGAAGPEAPAGAGGNP